MNRREFLKTMALAAGGALVYPHMSLLASSSPSSTRRTPHYFVFYYMIGGWDLTLLTEPFPHTSKKAFVQYTKDEIFEVGAHQYGPAMKPLIPYMNRMGLIRGIKIPVLNHPQARFLLHTGSTKDPAEGSYPSIQTLIAKKYGEKYKLPNLSSDGMRPAVFLGSQSDELHPLRIRSLDQLTNLTNIKGSFSDYSTSVLQALNQKNKLYLNRFNENQLARDFFGYQQVAQTIINSNLPELTSKANQNYKPLSAPGISAQNRWGEQANLAVEVIKNDLAPVITVGSGEFDSHTRQQFQHHRSYVERGIKTISLICEGLAKHKYNDKESLLDRTTIVVSSEFSRTPKLNELGGKHHWETNLVMLIGKGIKPHAQKNQPRVFGEATDTLHAIKINPVTGSLKKDTDDLFISHAQATILSIAGIDPVEVIDSEPIPDLII